MDISINGKAADITLEAEQTVGEVLSGVDGWLHSSGFALNGLEIDGVPVSSGAVSEAFERELYGISALDIKVCSRSELALDAFYEARFLLAAYNGALDKADGEEIQRIEASWEAGAAASFLRAEYPELYRNIAAVFTGDNAGNTRRAAVMILLDERIRELVDPAAEILRIEGPAAEIAGKLEELPLDIQTGKDGRAAESVDRFSSAAEKLFRLFYLVQAQGRDLSGIVVETVPVYDFLEEFSAVLKELATAYEAKDVVLVGDLAEYELAPRFRAFYKALRAAVERS
jgi:hypothetical protein